MAKVFYEGLELSRLSRTLLLFFLAQQNILLWLMY